MSMWPISWPNGAGPPSATEATAPSAPWSVALTHNRERPCASVWPACRSSFPGYGAQGATAADLAALFDADGTGAVVNSARAILYAYKKAPSKYWVDAARDEALAMKAALWQAAGRA